MRKITSSRTAVSLILLVVVFDKFLCCGRWRQFFIHCFRNSFLLSFAFTIGANLLTEHVCSVVIAPPSDGKISEQNDEFPVDIKLPVKHVLSRELQVCDVLLAIFFFPFVSIVQWFILFPFSFPRLCSYTLIKSQILQ